MVQGRLRSAPEHLRHLSERESSALDRDKRDTEKARTSRTLYRILSSRVGLTRIFEASPILQMGRNRVISMGIFFLRASCAESCTTSSDAKPETKSTSEPIVTPSVTKMEDASFIAPNTSELEHVTTTDETLDNQSPDMETDDNDASVLLPESHPNSATHTSQDLPPSASSSQLPRMANVRPQ